MTAQQQTREPVVIAEVPRIVLTIPEAGAALGVGRDQIYNLLRSGDLPYLKIGRQTRILVKDVEAFAEARVAQQQAVLGARQALVAARDTRRTAR